MDGHHYISIVQVISLRKNLSPQPKISRKRPHLVEKYKNIPWISHVPIPTKIGKFQAPTQDLEQKGLWKHFPGPKEVGVVHVGNPQGIHYKR